MIQMEVKKHNKAAVMVTHDERVLDLADRVYRLENGILIRIEAMQRSKSQNTN